MEDYLVHDLMVPLSEYATVPVGATLFEAVQALEKAQEEFDHAIYKHRGVLVVDDGGRVVGRLNHFHCLTALDLPGAGGLKIDELEQFGFSTNYLRNLRRQHRQVAAPLETLCSEAALLKVEELMHFTREDEFIDYKVTLDMAIHQLVQEKLRSLLVRKDSEIIGILRLSDVFAAVYHTMATNTA